MDNDNDKDFEYVVNDNEEFEILLQSVDNFLHKDDTLRNIEDNVDDSQVVAQEEIKSTTAPPKSSGITKSKHDILINIEDDAQNLQIMAQEINPTETSPKSKSESKQLSAVWNYFEKENNVAARCNICNKVFKHGGNTTNLFQHLSARHALFCPNINRLKRKVNEISESSDDSVKDSPQLKRVNFKSQKKLTKIDEAFEHTKSFLEGGKTHDKITNAILYMIAVDKMSLSTVENEGFKLLMKTVAPLYIVPSRKTVTRLIDTRYEVLKERFIATLKEIDSYSITCDNWTDVSNQSYLGVTIHYVTAQIEMKNGCIGVFPLSENHTSHYLEECLNLIMKDFNLDKSKITAVVTDSAANIKKAVRDFIGEDKHLACFAHTLSHLVPDVLLAMPTVRDKIAKVKAIVTFIRRSVVACDELKKLQIRDGKTEGTTLKFIQDVSTRWNSTLYMLERFFTLEEYIYPVISKCPNAPDILKREEMQILKDVVSLMKPIECVITEVSGDSYPTCSVIISLVHCLKVTVRKCKPVTKCGHEFKVKLEAIIDKRFKDFEFHKILAISNILDPRFKKIHFESALAASSAITLINNYIKKDTISKTFQKVTVESTTKEENCLWNVHDDLVATNIDHSVHSENVSFEIRQYLSQPVIPRHENPLKFWSSMKLGFPSLYKVAMKYISIIGTSVPSERLFSQAGDIKTDNRSRLSGRRILGITGMH